MSKHWIEKYNELKHQNKMWGEGINPPKNRNNELDPYNVYFVRECGFTFEFHTLEQMLACKKHFSRKIQPSTRIPESELWNYSGDHSEMQRWFEKLPKGLVSNKQRPKILNAFERALKDFSQNK
ncbi:hypothetical protein [Methylomonas methanica]|nr:hypothetical protein [Methylomonas methanica]